MLGVNANNSSSMNRSSFLDGVSKRNHSQNFIIHKCHELIDNSSNEIVERRGYCVSFLATHESVDANGRIFISGSVMNELVCHNKVKKKIVYNETVFFKDSWCVSNDCN